MPPSFQKRKKAGNDNGPIAVVIPACVQIMLYEACVIVFPDIKKPESFRTHFKQFVYF